MLTLSPGSSCDVCAEEYGRQTVPHSIPCGHVLCYACCSAIVEKTPSRLQPSCPFCREHFTIDGVRLIHIDIPNNGSSSGWSTPKKFPCVEANPLDITATEGWPTKLTALPDAGLRTNNAEVRRLENKVHSVANRKCSVEEVKTLKDELEVWLSAVKTNDQTSISLSAALLRAILMNHMAHSEASKHAKTVESNLKADLDDMQLKVEKLEAEVRRSRLELTQKTHECHTLRSEVARHGGSYSLPASPPDSRVTSPIPGIPSPPPSTSTSPTPYSTPNVARYPSVHSRSTSASIASRSATPSPSAPTRMYTPAPRSHTPNPTSSTSHYLSNTTASSGHARSQSIRRAQTPVSSASAAASASASASAAAVPPVPSVPVPPRMTTPAPNPNYMARAQTPGLSSSSASASTSSRSRRMSTSQSPKQMARSSSDETHQHQRWIPPSTVTAEPDGHHRGYTSLPVSRSTSSGQSGAYARVRA